MVKKLSNNGKIYKKSTFAWICYYKTQCRLHRERSDSEKVNDSSALVTRISLNQVVQLIKGLNDQQRSVVYSIDFGSMLDLLCTRMDLKFCRWLVKRFNPYTCYLTIHGHQVYITSSDVTNILGLRDEGVDINLSGAGEATDDVSDHGLLKGAISLPRLAKESSEMDSGGDEFMKKFVLYILGVMLCPTIKNVASQSLVKIVGDIHAVRGMNWARFVFNFLVGGVKKYKELHQHGKSGCILFLMLFYFDHVTPLCDDEPSLISRPRPRLSEWGDDAVKKGIKTLNSLGGYRKLDRDVVRVEDRVSKGGKLLLHDGVDKDDIRTILLEERLTKLETEFRGVRDGLENVLNIVNSMTSELRTFKDMILGELRRGYEGKSVKEEKDYQEVDHMS